jgi:hypothetical protein
LNAEVKTLQHGTAWAVIAKDPALAARKSTDLRDRFRNAYPDLYASCGYKPRKPHCRRRKAASPEKVDVVVQASPPSSPLTSAQTSNVHSPLVSPLSLSAPTSPAFSRLYEESLFAAPAPVLPETSDGSMTLRAGLHARRGSDTLADYNYSGLFPSYCGDAAGQQMAPPELLYGHESADANVPYAASYLREQEEHTVYLSDSAYGSSPTAGEWYSSGDEFVESGSPPFRTAEEKAKGVMLGPEIARSFSPFSLPPQQPPVDPSTGLMALSGGTGNIPDIQVPERPVSAHGMLAAFFASRSHPTESVYSPRGETQGDSFEYEYPSSPSLLDGFTEQARLTTAGLPGMGFDLCQVDQLSLGPDLGQDGMDVQQSADYPMPGWFEDSQDTIRATSLTRSASLALTATTFANTK